MIQDISDKDKKVTPTEVIELPDIDDVETELREMSREELLHRLKHEETNPEICKLIKKILKEKA